MQQHEYVLKNKPLQGETETRSDLWTLKGKEGKHLKRLTWMMTNLILTWLSSPSLNLSDESWGWGSSLPRAARLWWRASIWPAGWLQVQDLDIQQSCFSCLEKLKNLKYLFFRLLDAAETLVTLQTSDLGASNNPLFGSNNQVINQQFETFLISYTLWTMTWFRCSQWMG